MSVIAEISIFPVDKGISLSPYVARVIEHIRQSGLDYELGPMGTCIEGNWQEILTIIDQCFQEVHHDSRRVYMTLKIDYSKNREKGLQEKISSVKKRLSSKA
ncbi:MAG TPA: MTH1187 family thiamine-binding protein [Desulfohalobiaceae bacterium]|nr:MTH1187 family thiamine-binding protein [Desulfohalobiaceae bacterium]